VRWGIAAEVAQKIGEWERGVPRNRGPRLAAVETRRLVDTPAGRVGHAWRVRHIALGGGGGHVGGEDSCGRRTTLV